MKTMMRLQLRLHRWMAWPKDLLRQLRERSTAHSLYYIHSSEVLPPPLTPLQEEELFRGLEAGDARCRQKLIVHNLRLVVYIAKRFEANSSTSNLTVEDAISIGTIGLIKAVNTFVPSKKIKLATYASRCIENEILMYLRKSSNRRQESSIEEPLNTDGDGNELHLADVLGSDECVSTRIEEADECRALHRAIDTLGPRERQIMELRFGLRDGIERTQKEVADHIGISQSYISRLEKRIIRHLRREMEQASWTA